MDSERNPLIESGESSQLIIARIGDTPIAIQGLSWLPLTQFIALIFFTRQASKRKPNNTIFHWAGEGLLKTTVTLGSEWCHNLAHTMASNMIRKPMDQLRVQFGMPRCIYHEINDREVTPRQHLIRSLGGPVMNVLLLPVSWFCKKMTKPGSIAGETAKLFYQSNLFLSLVSLLPIPGIDGGPILKWSLVERGSSIEEADEVVRKTNGPLALILGLFSSWSFARKRILAGMFSGMLGLISLSVFAGWLKEENVKF